VDEAAWLASDEPTPMLRFIAARGAASDRKRRPFAIACVRRIWHLLSEPASRKVVEALESYAEGLASDRELRDAYDGATTVAHEADDFIGIDSLQAWAAHAAAGAAWFDAHLSDYPAEPRPGIDLFHTHIRAVTAVARAAGQLPTDDAPDPPKPVRPLRRPD
jgi:hypothetical protein